MLNDTFKLKLHCKWMPFFVKSACEEFSQSSGLEAFKKSFRQIESNQMNKDFARVQVSLLYQPFFSDQLLQTSGDFFPAFWDTRKDAETNSCLRWSSNTWSDNGLYFLWLQLFKPFQGQDLLLRQRNLSGQPFQLWMVIRDIDLMITCYIIQNL